MTHKTMVREPLSDSLLERVILGTEPSLEELVTEIEAVLGMDPGECPLVRDLAEDMLAAAHRAADKAWDDIEEITGGGR